MRIQTSSLFKKWAKNLVKRLYISLNFHTTLIQLVINPEYWEAYNKLFVVIKFHFLWILEYFTKLLKILGFEWKAIQASAEAQMITNAPVGFHPGLKNQCYFRFSLYQNLFDYILGRNSESPFEIMRNFTEAGGNGSKCAVGHIERK